MVRELKQCGLNLEKDRWWAEDQQQWRTFREAHAPPWALWVLSE